MHMPKPQAFIPPPAPAPGAEDAQVIAARQNELRRQKALYGRRSTILTGTGVGDTSFTSPTLMAA